MNTMGILLMLFSSWGWVANWYQAMAGIVPFLLVWLVPEEKDDKLHFLSDSDALISKGLVTLIASIYSNESPKDIATSEIDLMEEFDLGVILSPARRNGAYSMLKTIKEYAKKLS